MTGDRPPATRPGAFFMLGKLAQGITRGRGGVEENRNNCFGRKNVSPTRAGGITHNALCQKWRNHGGTS